MKKLFKEMELPIAIFAMTIIIFRFVFCILYIPTTSMENTILKDTSVVSYKLYGENKHIKRGDIVVFSLLGEDDTCSTATSHAYYIKRVVGVGGDTIEIKSGKTYINGEYYDETKWLKEEPDTSVNAGPFTVPDNCFFMMGDNRNHSNDSRFWKNPYVQSSQIIAKYLFTT